MKVTKKEISPLLTATFPEYKGRRFFVQPADKVTLYDLNWCEGTRNAYRACTTTGRKVGNGEAFNQKAPWNNNAEGSTIDIPAGAIVACHSYRGMTESVTFYINPADMPKFLTVEA